jgi:hypothetical protein
LLSIKDAKELATALKFPKELIDEEIKDEMSLADIYNLEVKVDFYQKKIEHDRVIGFGR